MALLTCVILLHLLNYTFGKNCVVNNLPEYIAWEKQLLKDLDCGYNVNRPPSENTTVGFEFIVKYFNFNSLEEVFVVQYWVYNTWKDERLKWDPEKYHGISETDVSHKSVWTPDYDLSTGEDPNLQMLILYRCILKSTGDVSCGFSMAYETMCGTQLTNWPYDKQECSFQFTPGSPQTENLTMIFISQPTYKAAQKSAEWLIVDCKQVEDHNSDRQLKLTYILEREAVGLAAIVICPVLALTALSILSLFMDVRRKVRLAVICFSVLGHYFFLKELNYDIPKESNHPPTLLLYYRGSIILTVTIILLTFLLAAMCKFKSMPHNYIKLINDFLYENNYRRHLVFPGWDFDDITVDSKSCNEDWVKFANAVNSAFIFVIAFAYIGLYASLMPKRNLVIIQN